MDHIRTMLPAGAVTLGREQPLRMAVIVPADAGAPLVEPATAQVSAAPAYTAPLRFDWRRNDPLAAPEAPPSP